MTDLELRLLTMAILAAGPGDLVDVYTEPIEGGVGQIHTVEVVNEAGIRWFAIHSLTLSESKLSSSTAIVRELRRQFAAPAALPRPE